MAEIPDAELKALLASVAALTAKVDELSAGVGTAPQRLLRKITERRVEVRRVDGKVVIGYRNRGSQARPVYIYEKPNPKDPAQKLSYVDLVLEGMKDGESLTVEYTQFRTESERVICRVLSTNEKEWEINQGIVKKREIDGYSAVELDFDVPVDIIGKTRFYTVELPGGTSVEVHENYVNIA